MFFLDKLTSLLFDNWISLSSCHKFLPNQQKISYEFVWELKFYSEYWPLSSILIHTVKVRIPWSFTWFKVYIMCSFNHANTNTYWDCEIRKRHKICIFKFLKFMSMKGEKCLIPVKSSLLCVYNNNRDLKKISLYKRYFDDDLLTVRWYKIDEPKR